MNESKKIRYNEEYNDAGVNVNFVEKNGVGIKTFQPGDPVTVNMHPLNDGRPGGNYITIVAADGNTYD